MLEIKQKQRPVLEAFSQFILQEIGAKSCIRSACKGYTLRVCSPGNVFPVLEAMLEAGLLQKRVRAELMLTRTTENHLDVKAELAHTKGNQGKFRRQNCDGDEESREIDRLQGKLRRLNHQGCLDSASALKTKIDMLKREHQLKELVREVRDMMARFKELVRLLT